MNKYKHHFIVNYTRLMFILSLVFFVYQFFIINYDYFGLHYRYLTVWALTGSLIISGLLLYKRVNGEPRAYHAASAVVAVLNALVVFLYWKMFFIDPSLINTVSLPIHQEYYLHGVGPSLIVLDALFINKSFQKHWQAMSGILSICFFYILWLEFFVSPLNMFPVGTQVHGFPYPFLNDMQIGQRCIFYVTTILTAVGFYLIGYIFTFAYMRIKN